MMDGVDTGATRTGTGTATRIMALLSLLADAGGPVSVRHAAEGLGLAPSTTHRLLNLLVEGGFAAYDGRTASYGIGTEFYRVAARVSADVSPASAARGLIADLARRYDETVLFGLYLPAAGKMAFVERADGQKKLLYRVDMNAPLSLVWGASGKAALAHLPEEEIARILAAETVSPATGQPPPDPATLADELASIREKGFCVSRGEKLPGALGIAAPVFRLDRVVGTICMTMPQDRAPTISPDDLGAEVARAAAVVTDRLGGAKHGG